MNNIDILADPPTADQQNASQQRNTVRGEADRMVKHLREQGAHLVEQANKTTDMQAAEDKAKTALALFDHLDDFSRAVDRALDETPDPATIDLAALHQGLVQRNPAAFKVSTPYVPTPPIHTWSCEDTMIEVLGVDQRLKPAKPRVLPMLRPIPSGGENSWSDYFAGGGGSSSGIIRVGGAFVKLAVNHWPLAIETHNYNHQDTDHDQASLARTDPGRYPRTQFAWFSPECTYWSVARGEKCDYDQESEQLALALMDDEDDTPEVREEKWRSRMLMRDVVRFSRHHQYEAVVVENVPDILKWAAMDKWLAEMVAEGYRYKILTLNSAFATAGGAPAPQLRDRVYIVFWKARHRTPNWRKWLSPKAYCTNCDEVVAAIYNPKPGGRRPMRYGPRSQYTYRCPKKKCAGQMAQPLVMPAGEAIDWSLPTQRIGDRKRPLAKKTRDRIAAGLARYCQPITVQTSGHTFERRPGVRSWPVDRPMTTQDTSVVRSVAAGPGMLVPCGGARSTTVTSTDEPMLTQLGRESRALVVPLEGRAEASGIRQMHEPFRAQTARHQDALLKVPESLLVPLRNNGTAENPAVTPYRTFAAGGNHHALVMRNNLGGAEMCTPTDEPIRTLTTAGHQSLVQWDALYSYDTGQLRPLADPMPTQTGVEGDALFGAGPEVDVDDCTLRMLQVHEVQAGMAFAPEYVLLGNAKRWKIRMLGNAVTPNAARDLAACVMEAVTGVDIPLYDDDPAYWALAA